MNKLKSEEALERIANFLEQLVIDKFNITDEHEFLVLTEYCRNTLFYDSQKDKIDLNQYHDIKDVYHDMIYKISSTPMLTRFIVVGLLPVMYDVWRRDKCNEVDRL